MKTSIIRKALVLLMVLVCQQVHAHDFEVNGIYYGISLFNKNTAYVTHKGKDYAQSYAYSDSISINIPDKVTYNGKTYTVATIGGYAFWNCADLKSVTLPNTITDIHQHAFEGCHGLETIAIPASVNKIHDQAFFNCHKLNLIELKHTTPPTLGNGVFEGVNYNQARLKVPFSAYNTYKNNSTWNSFKLAHYDVNGIYYQPVSNSQVKVSYRNIYDENSGTFYNSYSGNVTIPSEVTIDGNKCTVTSIGEKAFSESGGLKSVVIPSSVHTIEEQAFYDCFSMTSVTIGNGVTTINSSAFHGCTGLTSVTIPNSVTNIGDYAFTGCSSIKTLSLGSKVSNISNYAFYGCKGLISVTSLNPTPPTCGTDVFMDVNVAKIPLTVPAESISLYKAKTPWSNFKFEEQTEPEEPSVPEQPENPSEPELPEDTSGLSYKIINSTDVEVIAGAEEYSGDIIIPSQTTIEGKAYNVTKIADEAFYACSGLKTITIPNSVTSIGNYVLGNCPNLTSIVVESGNKKYDSRNNCNAIIETSTNSLIAGCKNSVIPSSVTTIGTASFMGCTGLTSITIPSSVVSLGEDAFYECTGLTSMTIPNSVTSIGDNVFAYCSNLKTITLSTNIKTISYSAFLDCYSLTSITVPNSVITIEEEAFCGCDGLADVIIGNSVASIGNHAFLNCGGLTSVTMLNSTPPSCGTDVFKNVNVSNVTLTVPTGSVSKYKSADTWKDFKYEQTEEPTEPELPVDTSGLSYNILNSTDVEVIAGAKKYSGDIVIPSQTTIDGKVYNVTKIGDNAFYDCTGLTSVTIGNSVTGIGYDAFCYCSSLASVIIPDGVTSIGENAFRGCSGLTSVTIGNSVTSIGDYAFYYCSNLTSVNISDIEAWCKIDFSSYDSNPLYYAKNLYLNGELLTNIEIPNSITEIKQYAFSRCSGLKSVTIPNSVTSIGKDAFYGCSGLTSVTIPNSVTSISNYAFSGCSGLTSVIFNAENCETMGSSNYSVFSSCTKLSSVTIGQNVKNIPSYAFRGCSGLTSVTIPESVTSIGDYAFDGCSGLTSVTIGNSVTSIGSSAFRDCSGLTSVTIGNSVTSIGDYAFYYCSGLTSVTIGNSVTSIGRWAFYGCSGLTSITIPNSVIRIGMGAFAYCSGLTSVISLNPTPPTCEPDVFYNESVESITLEVPSESVSLYQSADKWKDFSSIKGIESAEKSVLTFNKLNTTEVEVIAGTEKYTGDIVIPSKVLIDDNIYSVVSVANNAFQNCTGLTSIEISNNVKSIGNRAFSGCSSLVQAKIGDGVTSIGQHAFYDCKKMTDLTIGESVTSLESDAFNGCTNLSQITLPSSLECIKSYAFQNCYGLKDITIPDNVKTIEHYAFTSCSSLGCITLGKSVNSVGNLAFSNCKSLNNVISLNTTPPLCDGKPFASENLALKTLEVPSESVSLYQSADIWKDFGTIKGVAGASALIYMILNETDVEVIAGAEKYSGDIVIPSQTTIDGKVYNVTRVGNSAFYYCSGLTSITIPNSVTGIGEKAFSGCSGLTSITIPEGVTSICSYAFYYCSGLTSITIPEGVTSIGYRAFENCIGLTSITIPEGVTSIGEKAFYGCSGLTSITIPNSVTSIGSYAFYYCSGLTSIVVESGNTVYDSRDNCNAIIETSTNTLITGFKNTVIPNSVTSIGGSAFSGCSGLTSITIPNSVTIIGKNAFYGCSGLTSITIPNSVTSIGGNAFRGCSGLTSIVVESGNTVYDSRNNCNAIIETSTNTLITGFKNTVIPNSVTSIGDEAFFGCSGLTSITIPEGVASIGDYAFQGCSGLTSITILEGVTSIGDHAFQGCSGLTSITIPNSVTSIGQQAFYYCSKLTSITIPNSVTSIGEWVFSGCSGLTSVTIGNSVTSIGNYAFQDCIGLISIISLNPTPPTCGTDVFKGVNVGNITLEVPSESISLYQSANTWKDFGTITTVSSASRSESSGIDDILADGDEVEYYNLHGVRIVNPTKGIYIKREGNKVTKVVL